MNLVIGVGVSLLCCMIVDKAVGDQLFFFEEDEKSRCSAYTITFPEQRKTKRFTLEKCPEDTLYYDNFLYYSLGNKIYKRSSNWDVSKEQIVAEMPPGELYAGRFWIDAKTKRIRFAFLKVIGEKDIVHHKKKNDDDRSVSFRYKGKIKKLEFTLGIPAMALSFDLVDGKWKLVEEKPTDSEACDTLGLRALSNSPEDGVGKPLYMHSTQSPKTEANVVNADILKKIEKPEWGSPIVLQLKNNKLLITFKGSDGERVRGFGKEFYFCDVPCLKPRKMAEKEHESALAAFGEDHFILSIPENEYRIYSLKNEQLVMTKILRNIYPAIGWLP